MGEEGETGAAEAPRASERRFRRLADAAPFLIWTARPPAECTYVNRAWLDLTGRAAEEALGAGWLEALHPDDRERFREALGAARRGGFRLEVRMRRADGSWRWVLHQAAPLEEAGDEGEEVVGSGVDITERKAAEGDLARHVAELARSNLELEQYAYMASHDLQEPLRMVRSYTQLLSQRYGPLFDEQGREFLSFINDGVLRMQELIRSLLALSRVRVRPEQVEAAPLVEALRDAQAGLEAEIRESGAEIRHGPLPVVRGVPPLLTQLLQILIGNAIKFRSEAPPRVDVEAERAEDAWIVSVRDNGIGFPQQHAERIFGIFQRLHPRGKYPGTGVGLAIAKKIVDQHGGRIWATSAPGGGSVFRFTLPG